MSENRIYRTFIRAWWKKVAGELVPYPDARKTVVRQNLTYKEAQEMCREHNLRNDPGPLSRKMEFEIS